MIAETSLVIGDNDYTISGDDIISLTITESASLMLDVMASDVCEAVVKSESDYPDSLPYGTKVSIYRESAVQDVFYLTEVTRVKKDQYRLEMTSFLGILDGEMFYGGYYTGEELHDVVETIIQTNGLNLTTTDHSDMVAMIEYDAAFADVPIYGWLKVGTKKEALHQVLFSRGISMKKTSGGVILFTSLYETDPIVISGGDIYQEADVTFIEKVSTVEVTEHTFTNDPNASLEVLFESEQQTEFGVEYIAVYNTDSPVLQAIQTSGLTVTYHNCNAAVVSGIGTIKGYPSVHSETVIKSIIRPTKGETVTVDDCTLITRQNSAFIMDRFTNYCMTAETELSTDFVRTNQKVGSHVSVINAFGERVSGYITEITQTVSGIIKAACKIITGYQPLEYDGYNRFVVLTGSGGWAVPESVLEKPNPKVQVVLIGGGTGGASGKAGENGAKVPYGNTSTTGAAGGKAGNGGDGGKILVVTINNPAATLYYSCGNGGAGGAASSSTSTSNAGSAGGNTTLTSGGTTYTSNDGNRSDNGVTNFMNGKKYGLSYNQKNTGAVVASYGDGYPGGKCYFEGGTGKVPDIAYLFSTWYEFDLLQSPAVQIGYYNFYAANGNSAAGGTGGAGGGNAWNVKGGSGGNASSGASGNGGAGASPTYALPKPSQLIGAIGGNDELFLPVDDGGFGDGGFGGFGGGGGGSGGATAQNKTQGSGGAGGKGGPGGAGADGCVIIYY